MSVEDSPEFIVQQSRETFTRLYAEVFPRARTYIIQNSGNEEDARDIFQESLIAAWMNGKNGKFSGDIKGFSAYILTIVRYKWLNRLDSSEHRKTVYNDSTESYHEQLTTAEDPARHQEESRILQECMKGLDGTCRDILTRFYYKKEGLQQIASALKYSAESVKTIKYRCMQRLRKQYIEKIKSSEK